MQARKIFAALAAGVFFTGMSRPADAQINQPELSVSPTAAQQAILAARAAHDPRRMRFAPTGAPGSAAATTQGSPFEDFAVSGAITTLPTGINDNGEITGMFGTEVPVGTGYYVAFHGFLRAPDGAFVRFDAPNAIATFNSGTMPQAVNAEGAVAGYYQDINFVYHAFLRTPDGLLTTIDFPGAQLTSAWGINAAGEVTGNYFTPGSGTHGFLREPDGSLISFDPPGAGTLATYPIGVDSAGTIAGTFFDQDFGERGFLRYRNGTFFSFAITNPQDGTQPIAISPDGIVTGFYYDDSYATHGFVRDPGGTITSFDPTGSTSTSVIAINSAGAVIGYYYDANNAYHAFLRSRQGEITPLNQPGYPAAINDSYEVTGYYFTAHAIDGFSMNPDIVYHQ